MAKGGRFEGIKIAIFAMLAAIGYGIVHDQVTAHLCVEYFTVAHPPVFTTQSPFLLALGWGVIASWWVGMSLGIGLAAAARIGPWPRLGLAELRRPIAYLMLASALAALVAGVCGAVLLAGGIVRLPDEWTAAIPAHKHVPFAAAAWAHTASYASGALGGLFVIGRTLRIRIRLRRLQAELLREPPAPSPRGAEVARELEQRHGFRLPEDFKAYLAEAAPESDWMDHDGIIWWAPERIRSLREECGSETPAEQANAEIEAEAHLYLVFADFLDWCYAYAICCSDGPNRGKVALIGIRPDRFVATSFTRFVELAAEGSRRLHSPAGDGFTDLV